MRITKTQVYGLIETIKTNYGFKVQWTCCSPEGRLRWWVSVENENKRFSRCEMFGSTYDVYMWLKGIISGLWLIS